MPHRCLVMPRPGLIEAVRGPCRDLMEARKTRLEAAWLQTNICGARTGAARYNMDFDSGKHDLFLHKGCRPPIFLFIWIPLCPILRYKLYDGSKLVQEAAVGM